LTADDNAEIVRRFVQALNTRDVGALVGLVTDDVTWHFPGHNAMAGDHTGLPAVGAFMQGLAQRMRSTPVLELHDVAATDDHATEMARVTLERDGETHVWWTLRAYHFRDGRISEIFATTDQQHLVDELIGAD
jgi:ketosteroid isomerase-like protein